VLIWMQRVTASDMRFLPRKYLGEGLFPLFPSLSHCFSRFFPLNSWPAFSVSCTRKFFSLVSGLFPRHFFRLTGRPRVFFPFGHEKFLASFFLSFSRSAPPFSWTPLWKLGLSHATTWIWQRDGSLRMTPFPFPFFRFFSLFNC